jgi:sec-independent protein translocase protein TatC
MATALRRPVAHDDRLSLVEHLDELRTRLILSLVAFLLCFGVCFWQNDRILDVMNEPLEKTAFKQGSEDPLERSAGFQQAEKQLFLQTELFARALSRDSGLSPETRRMAEQVAAQAKATAAAAPRVSGRRPVTLGVGEPFTATFRVAAYAALLLALPFLLYQAYAFVLPAFSPQERQVALPLMLMVPFLFVAGAFFAWVVVLPKAISFLQNFNDDSFDILLQAKDFYRFEIMVLIAMGLLFQIPIGILAVTRLGIVTPQQLRKQRRYAILVVAIVAMLLPGTDPVTMTLMALPLYALYEGSILLASLLDRRAARARAREEADLAAADHAELVPSEPEDH